MTSPPAPPRLPTVSVAAIAWVLVVALFILLRVGLVWRAPVGGAELAHLSGAWQARIGVEDDRYVPTLYQAVTALTLGWTESEQPARAIALAGALTIPLALFMLRRQLGEGGALLALLLFALDPAGIVLGVTATAAAWDAAIALWLVVALVAGRPPPWSWLPIAFLVATAGPLSLTVVLAATVSAALHRLRPTRETFLWGAAGTALGLLLTSLQFGVDVDGLRIAAFSLFVAGFDESWSTLTVAELAALYGLPLLVGGAAAVAWLAVRLRDEGRSPTPMEALSLGVAGIAMVWFLAALPTHSPFPLAAATFVSCLLLGPALARLAGRLMAITWRRESWLLLLALALVAIACFVLSDWARQGHVGGAFGRALLVVAGIGAVTVLTLLATYRESWPLTLLAPVAVGGVLLLAGSNGIALSAAGEPLPGPASPSSARAIRDVALSANTSGGSIVVHERYREALTWPFRDSGTLVLASRVPAGAGVVVWPADAPPPEGFVALDGRWVLQRAIDGPDGFLAFVHWFAERNSLDQRLEIVAVYVRAP
ncbi:MAG: hypothetical protein F4X03_03435 [Dehalococcoidia bacterium]|nr:hypothetical protein [Dehalococcoidia bacterium]MYD27958.1 hypothetical protein [Dehalococcoidia bacterium]